MGDAVDKQTIPTPGTPEEAKRMLRAVIDSGQLSEPEIRAVIDEQRTRIGEKARLVVERKDAPSEEIIRAANIVFSTNRDGIGRDALQIVEKALRDEGSQATVQWAPVPTGYRNSLVILKLGRETVAVPLPSTGYSTSTQNYYHHERHGRNFRRANRLIRVCVLDEDGDPIVKGQDHTGRPILDDRYIGIVGD